VSELHRVKRRHLLGWFGVGLLASYLPVALAACSPGRKQQSRSVADGASNGSQGNNGFQVIGTVEQLDANGSLLAEQAMAQPVLAVRAPQRNNLLAVNPKCTHQGCTVEWQTQEQTFACPCHGSEFDAQGQVISGPATQPLSSYPVKIEGGQVLVKPQSG